jgi:hypothetical protein
MLMDEALAHLQRITWPTAMNLTLPGAYRSEKWMIAIVYSLLYKLLHQRPPVKASRQSACS